MRHFGDYAGMGMPYRNRGEVTPRSWVILAGETGMDAYDVEVDRPVLTGSPVKAAARLGGLVVEWALWHLA
ncbi:hypothetical protein Afil01_32830 [Actinorhabdospora filicis]|uniref:Uncharacterized protein n=1 Tax=Actinorhabdospora filicis TaxID=1785913 RepID=A0A9W6SPQ4_9ACTN|nr:hypothetical protein [Actinorhabdospora filicis]GLZ78476.1 hypothetical protein Afil01_32830 [Actinorhabdospora filicis]